MNHDLLMKRCISLGLKALGNTYPNPNVGALLFYDGKIISEGFTKEHGSNHAEINVINKISDNEVLKKSTLYVTLEPCLVCVRALMHARIERIVFGAKNTRNGFCGSILDITNDKQFNHHVIVDGGILEDQCQEILKSFFRLRR